jgi:hypothetical protein
MTEIKLTIRQSDGTLFDVHVPSDATVFELKQVCVEGCKLEPEAQRLIFKGKLNPKNLTFN